MKRFCLLMCLCLTGCDFATSWEKGNGHYRIFLDPTWDEPQLSLLQDSVSSWQTAMENTISLSYWDNNVCSFHDQNFIRIIPSTRASLSLGDDGCWKDSGWVLGMTTYSETSSLVQVAVDLDDDSFSEVTMHELGHAMGLDHDVEGTLMHWSSTNGSDTITCRDVQQFCSIWNCRADQMAICQ